MNTLQSEWESYAATVLKDIDPKSIQYDESRKTFYAASSSILTIMSNICEDDISDEAGEIMLKNLMDELMAFQEEMQARIAP